MFTPKLGEDEPNLTSIFFKWVGSTTNQICLETFWTTNPSRKIFQFIQTFTFHAGDTVHPGPSRDYSRVTDAFDQLVKKARLLVVQGRSKLLAVVEFNLNWGVSAIQPYLTRSSRTFCLIRKSMVQCFIATQWQVHIELRLVLALVWKGWWWFLSFWGMNRC